MDNKLSSSNMKYKDMSVEDIIKELQHMHYQRYDESIAKGAKSFKNVLLFLLCGITIIACDRIFNSTFSWVSLISIPFFIGAACNVLTILGFLGSVALGEKYGNQDIVRGAIRLKYGECTQEMLNEHMHSSQFISDFIMGDTEQQQTEDDLDNQS